MAGLAALLKCVLFRARSGIGRSQDAETEMRLLSRVARNRSLRAAAVWTLVMVQAEFLWLGEFHRHGDEQASYGRAVSLLDGKQAPQDLSQRPFCVACQISLERAASPVVGRAPAAPVAMDHCPAAYELWHSPRFLLGTPSPRAPPTI